MCECVCGGVVLQMLGCQFFKIFKSDVSFILLKIRSVFVPVAFKVFPLSWLSAALL